MPRNGTHGGDIVQLRGRARHPSLAAGTPRHPYRRLPGASIHVVPVHIYLHTVLLCCISKTTCTSRQDGHNASATTTGTLLRDVHRYDGTVNKAFVI